MVQGVAAIAKVVECVNEEVDGNADDIDDKDS